MKRAMIFLMIICSLLILSSCGSDNKILELNEEHFYTVLAADALFLNNKDAIFISPFGFQGVPPHDSLAITKMTSTSDGTITGTPLYYIDNTYTASWTPIAFDKKDDFYLPVWVSNGQHERHRIMKFSLLGSGRNESEENGTILKESQDIFYSNFYIENESLILFEPSFENNQFIYRITNINLLNEGESIIIEKMFSSTTGFGEVIVNIFVDGDSIYLYRIQTTEEGERAFYIDEYDFEGNKMKSFPLTMDDFLMIPEVNDEDSVFRIHKSGDFFVLSTYHNRIAILKLIDETFTQISTPASFKNIGETILIEGFSAEDNQIYFRDLHNVLYIFDTLNEEFFSIELSQQQDGDFKFSEDKINNILRDKEGNILIQIRVDVNAWEKHNEEIQKKLEEKGEYQPMGDGFPPGSSFYYWVDAAELQKYWTFEDTK